MAKDPEFRARVLAAQAESRRQRRERDWQRAVAEGRACHWEFPNGRHCWKAYAHTHDGGKVYVGHVL